MLFSENGVHEETSALNMIDIGGCWSMTLADTYASIPKVRV